MIMIFDLKLGNILSKMLLIFLEMILNLKPYLRQFLKFPVILYVHDTITV